MEDKERIESIFMRKFTYEAGDGFRMDTSPSVPKKVISFILAELSAKQSRITELESSIGELLAVMHGDGGHYQEKHGTVKAIQDVQKLLHVKWVTNEQLTDIKEALLRITELEEALRKINDIRNSIVGCQGFNFSEHAYPLVAILNGLGIQGLSYPEAKENVGTLINKNKELEEENKRLKKNHE